MRRIKRIDRLVRKRIEGYRLFCLQDLQYFQWSRQKAG